MDDRVVGTGAADIRSYFAERLRMIQETEERLAVQRQRRAEEREKLADGRLERATLERLALMRFWQTRAEREILGLGGLRDLYL